MDFFRVFGVAVSCQKRIIIFIKEQIAVLWKGVLFGEEDRVVKAKYSIKNHYGFIIRIIIRLKYGRLQDFWRLNGRISIRANCNDLTTPSKAL